MYVLSNEGVVTNLLRSNRTLAVTVTVDNKFNIQHSTMSSVLPFDIISEIIDIVGENQDTNFL